MLPLDTLLLLDELLRVLPLDTLLLLDELLPLLRDTLLLVEPLRETLLLVELLREVDEPVRVVPVELLLRVDVPTFEDSLRRVAVVALPVRLAEVLRLLAVVALLRLLPDVLSARLEPVRVGVSDVSAVRRFSSESTFTIRLFSSREGMLTNPALRSRRLFS